MKSILFILSTICPIIALQFPPGVENIAFRCEFTGTHLSLQEANTDSLEEIPLVAKDIVTIDMLITFTTFSSLDAGNFQSFIITGSDKFPFAYGLNHTFYNSADTTDSIACMSYGKIPASDDNTSTFILHLETVNTTKVSDSSGKNYTVITDRFILSNRDSLFPEHVINDNPFGIEFTRLIKVYKNGSMIKGARSVRLLSTSFNEHTGIAEKKHTQQFKPPLVRTKSDVAAETFDLLGRKSAATLPCMYIFGSGSQYYVNNKLSGYFITRKE